MCHPFPRCYFHLAVLYLHFSALCLCLSILYLQFSILYFQFSSHCSRPLSKCLIPLPPLFPHHPYHWSYLAQLFPPEVNISFVSSPHPMNFDAITPNSSNDFGPIIWHTLLTSLHPHNPGDQLYHKCTSLKVRISTKDHFSLTVNVLPAQNNSTMLGLATRLFLGSPSI